MKIISFKLLSLSFIMMLCLHTLSPSLHKSAAHGRKNIHPPCIVLQKCHFLRRVTNGITENGSSPTFNVISLQAEA